ncbi:hypothetical protein COV20_00200 [Candidatus Woesearchaeota archaeon CG10_big_fil_rev_8_21_14_0_10_45_16]|nr:MAG: hypothetical protein COV20_00200 [Candidatus Woesearchaeota archaeon CG10_big_fil_rev_8_21_14_0_10_45_16]
MREGAFDRFAWIYDPIMKLMRRNRSLRKRIESSAGFNAAVSVLDVGGGTGLLIDSLADKVKEITILDPSRKMLSKNKNPKIKKIQGIVQKMPFRDEKFDIILCVDSFHHFTNGSQKRQWQETITNSLKELKRVLKRDGTLIIVEFDPLRLETKAIRFFENKILGLGSFFLKENDLREKLQENGFSSETRMMNRYTYLVKSKKSPSLHE